MSGWSDEVHATLTGTGRLATVDPNVPHGGSRIAFSPALGGAPDAQSATPEHLLASASVSCWLLTFADAAQRLRIEIVRASASARIDVVSDGPGFKIDAIELRPELVVRGERDVLLAIVKRACDIAGRYCIVEKALRPGVARYEVIPSITFEPR